MKTDHEAPGMLDTCIDTGRLIELYDDDVDFKTVVFETFLSEIDEQKKEFEQLFHDEDWLSLAKQSHKIKPSMGMVGLTKTEVILKSIETSIKNEGGITDEILLKINLFLTEFENLKAMVINELKKLEE